MPLTIRCYAPIFNGYTETEMSFCRNFHHWLRQKLSRWWFLCSQSRLFHALTRTTSSGCHWGTQIKPHPKRIVWSKWEHFCFSAYGLWKRTVLEPADTITESARFESSWWVRITTPVSSLRHFLLFQKFSNQLLQIEYYVHIWQVLAQRSCANTCQIWRWFKGSNRRF